MPEYEVTVGNIGMVLRTESKGLAMETAVDYDQELRHNMGRGEYPIVVWEDGEPIDETEKPWELRDDDDD